MANKPTTLGFPASKRSPALADRDDRIRPSNPVSACDTTVARALGFILRSWLFSAMVRTSTIVLKIHERYALWNSQRLQGFWLVLTDCTHSALLCSASF